MECCTQAKFALPAGGAPYFQRASSRSGSPPRSLSLKGGFARMRSAFRSLCASFWNEPSLSISVSTLYGWVWQRRIPFIKIGRALRFDSHDLKSFVESNKQYPRQQSSRSGSRNNPCYNTRAAGKG